MILNIISIFRIVNIFWNSAPIRLLNNVLGINEAEFLRETKATIKLAIKFENWRVQGESYFHSFGVAGKTMAFCPFHHLEQIIGMMLHIQ